MEVTCDFFRLYVHPNELGSQETETLNFNGKLNNTEEEQKQREPTVGKEKDKQQTCLLRGQKSYVYSLDSHPIRGRQWH